jgi:proteasome lid subunit RPN8/RPN11
LYRGSDGIEVAVPEQVVDRIAAFGASAAPREWCGLVVGRICEDDLGRHVVVLGVVPDPDAHTGNYSVKTTTESEFRTRLNARTLYPDGSIVGWVHTHPRLGLAFSGTDFRNQATWTQPHSLGLVVDPWHPDRIRVYRGPEGEQLTQGAPTEHSVALVSPEARRADLKLRALMARVRRPILTALRYALRTLPLLVLVGLVYGALRYWSQRLARLEDRVSAVESQNADHPAPSLKRPNALGIAKHTSPTTLQTSPADRSEAAESADTAACAAELKHRGE